MKIISDKAVKQFRAAINEIKREDEEWIERTFDPYFTKRDPSYRWKMKKRCH